MKIKMMSRNPEDYIRETKKDIFKMPRNYDSEQHPFEVTREYTRALNAVKLERVFAKPFLANLEGHKDGVQCLSKHPTQLSTLFSGSCDGELKIWNLATQKCVKTQLAHDGFVRGICTNANGSMYYTCGADKVIKHWTYGGETNVDAVQTIIGKTFYTAIDHCLKKPVYATSGERIDIWDETRIEPLKSYTWGVDSHYTVRFNPIETSVLASSAADRSIILYDIRQTVPLRKVILEMNTNAICWNPLEAMIFTIANEDYNLYTFDMRNLNKPIQIHKDHVSAVLSVDYAPTGKEFVTSSYDKTIRIFPVNHGHSREVYHTKRMQHVTNVKWSLDNKYIISASDEMNIRLWKSNASEKIGLLKFREKEQFNYNQKLKEKFKHFPEIKRIKRHRHLPKTIYNSTKELRKMRQSIKRKEGNKRVNSKPNTVPLVSEKTKHVIDEVE